MALRYHQAVFDLMGKRPRPSKRAVAALEKRERALGITLPASLKEFYSLQGACAILTEHSNTDLTVPIEMLGDPEELAHGVIRIQDENQGVAAWYVRLDGSDDPPVEVECEGNRREPPEGVEDYSLWDVAEFHRVADRFSAFVYERLLVYGGQRQDREVAAKLKPYGGLINFDEQGRSVSVRFEVRRSADARGKTPAKPFDAADAMGLVRKLEQLQCLEIRSAKVGASGWAAVKDHPGIVLLEDSGSLDDAAVKHVVAMPALRELSVFNNRLTDAGLTRLLQGHQFTSLTIGVGKKLTARGLEALSAQTGIEWLSVHDCGHLSDEGLAGLAGLASLRVLDINSTRLSDDGLRHIAGLSGLDRLSLYLDGITDAGLAHLAGLTSLTYLRIWRAARVSGSGFRHLTGLHKVRELDVRELPITDESLVHLSGFQDLEVLDLSRTKVVGPGFKFLSGLSRLRKLDCRWNGFVDEGMPHLARLSSLERLDLAHARITDAGLRALAPLSSLQHLDLTGANVSAAAIRDLKAAIPRLSYVCWTRPGTRPDVGTPFDFRANPGQE